MACKPNSHPIRQKTCGKSFQSFSCPYSLSMQTPPNSHNPDGSTTNRVSIRAAWMRPVACTTAPDAISDEKTRTGAATTAGDATRAAKTPAANATTAMAAIRAARHVERQHMSGFIPIPYGHYWSFACLTQDEFQFCFKMVRLRRGKMRVASRNATHVRSLRFGSLSVDLVNEVVSQKVR